MLKSQEHIIVTVICAEISQESASVTTMCAKLSHIEVSGNAIVAAACAEITHIAVAGKCDRNRDVRRNLVH